MATVSLARTPAVPLAAHRPGLAETVRSEFIKMRSVRSTYWTVLALVVASIAWAGFDCAGIVSHWPNNMGFQPYALRAVLLSAAVVTVFGLLAYGTGAIIRNTAGAITAILGVIFLVPLLAQALPNSWFWDLERWLPGGPVTGPISGGLAQPANHLFSAAGEFAVFCGYAVVLLAADAWLFCRRDA